MSLGSSSKMGLSLLTSVCGMSSMGPQVDKPLQMTLQLIMVEAGSRVRSKGVLFTMIDNESSELEEEQKSAGQGHILADATTTVL